MGRTKTYSREQVLERVVPLFWHRGYEATSMDTLVAEAGVSRHGLYAEFGDKHGLFLAALDHYSAHFVTAAIAPLESAGASLPAIRDYFHRLIDIGETRRWPGCLMANTLAERAAHVPAVRRRTQQHLERLAGVFEAALRNAATGGELAAQAGTPAALAAMLAVYAQGLWVSSRSLRNPARLRAAVDALLAPLAAAVPRASSRRPPGPQSRP